MFNRDFGNGMLFAAAMTGAGMAIVYAVGSTPNLGILLGTVIMGIYYRGKGN